MLEMLLVGLGNHSHRFDQERSNLVPLSKKKPPLFPSHTHWQSCYESWLASLHSTLTRRHYEGAIRRFFEFCYARYGKRITPDRVRRVDVEAFLGGAHNGKPWSPYTYNAYYQALCRFFAYASTYEIVFRGKPRPLLRGALPTTGIVRAHGGSVDRSMTEEEITRFFSAIDRSTLVGKRDYALFWTLFVTGRRRMEITNLRRGDLERVSLLKDGALRRGWLFWYRGKWRTERESAEMPEECMEAIREFHAAAGRDIETMDANEPLFPGVAGDAIRTQPMALAHVGARFRKIARRAGLPDRLVPHSLRWGNSYQRYLANGKDLMKVVEELGWKSVEQAAHYVRMTARKEQGDQTAGKIAAKFRRTDATKM
jgi:integrase